LEKHIHLLISKVVLYEYSKKLDVDFTFTPHLTSTWNQSKRILQLITGRCLTKNTEYN